MQVRRRASPRLACAAADIAAARSQAVSIAWPVRPRLADLAPDEFLALYVGGPIDGFVEIIRIEDAAQSLPGEVRRGYVRADDDYRHPHALWYVPSDAPSNVDLMVRLRWYEFITGELVVTAEERREALATLRRNFILTPRQRLIVEATGRA